MYRARNSRGRFRKSVTGRKRNVRGRFAKSRKSASRRSRRSTRKNNY
jgi:hypothetical protein